MRSAFTILCFVAAGSLAAGSIAIGEFEQRLFRQSLFQAAVVIVTAGYGISRARSPITPDWFRMNRPETALRTAWIFLAVLTGLMIFLGIVGGGHLFRLALLVGLMALAVRGVLCTLYPAPAVQTVQQVAILRSVPVQADPQYLDPYYYNGRKAPQPADLSCFAQK